MSRSLILDSDYLQTAIGSHFLTQWHALFHYFPIPVKSVMERFNPEIRLAIDTALVCCPLLKNGADLGQQMMRVSMNVSARTQFGYRAGMRAKLKLSTTLRNQWNERHTQLHRNQIIGLRESLA